MEDVINISTWDFVKKYRKKDWSWYYISTHPNITWEIIKNNPNAPWDPAGISTNPNIDWDIVQEMPDTYWDWSCLSMNPSIFELTTRQKIQIAPVEAERKRNSAYLVCKRRLQRGFELSERHENLI